MSGVRLDDVSSQFISNKSVSESFTLGVCGHENGNVIGTEVNLHFTKGGKYTLSAYENGNDNEILNSISNTYRIIYSRY